MGLAESLRQEPPRKANNLCGVAILRDALSDTDRDALDTALQQIASVPSKERSSGHSPYTSNWLRRALLDNGHRVSRSTLNAHIAGECSCGLV